MESVCKRRECVIARRCAVSDEFRDRPVLDRRLACSATSGESHGHPAGMGGAGRICLLDGVTRLHPAYRAWAPHSSMDVDVLFPKPRRVSVEAR